MIPDNRIIQKQDIIYPYLLGFIFVFSIIYFAFLIRHEKKTTNKSYDKIVINLLRDNDELFTTILALLILIPMYFILIDRDVDITIYISISFIILLFCYILKLLLNKIFR